VKKENRKIGIPMAKPVIDRIYSLDDTPEACRYLESGHARGKVVITMEHSSKT
jgi:NADPH:quinone reductase-like Zn-dependent oxidoreductase